MRSALKGSLAVPELAKTPEIVDPILQACSMEIIRARNVARRQARAKALEEQWLSRPAAFFHINERRRR